MPPNLGGFFMVRSYYPSECHADYFDFERIEALKPAIEACGISTLSQSPMLGFHKQMDNRIKLLEDMLSRRIQFVEFDNGDFFFQAENAIRDVGVTGVQTCALPIYMAELGGVPKKPLEPVTKHVRQVVKLPDVYTVETVANGKITVAKFPERPK